MRFRVPLVLLIVAAIGGVELLADELPRLPKEVDPKSQNYAAQKLLTDLPTAYVSASPEDLKDGLQVGVLDMPGTKEAVAKLVADDKAGKYQNLDSLLLWKDGKLIFEMYNRGGRVDGPHYAMSVTKTLTSVTLARAIQLGLLNMVDLDKPVISFMPEIDRSTIRPGIETVTLRDALFMKSGLRFEDRDQVFKLGYEHSRQQYFQQLFELTAPVTPESKAYKYTGTDPSIIMMIIDIRIRNSKRYENV
jgi:CubicO group peptidase (beta-lactamase class C family)